MRRFLGCTLLVLATLYCNTEQKPAAKPLHGANFLISANGTANGGLRCILHTDSLNARVDSCTTVTSPSVPPVVPPAPPSPPPSPAPAPPPPPPVADTVVATVKVSPNPVSLAAGKTFQLTGGAYNKSGALVPNAGVWISDNAAVVAVDATGKITGLSAGTTNVEFVYKGTNAWSTVTVTGIAPPPPTTTSSTIAPADSFSRSVGVGTHFSYFDLSPYSPNRMGSAYGVDSNLSHALYLVKQIKALGVYFVRDGIPYSTDKAWTDIAYAPLTALTQSGIKVISVVQPNATGQWSTTNGLDTALARLGAKSILAFEGPNEVDNNNGWWGGIPAYGANTKTFQCAAYAKAHAAGVTAISPTVTSTIGASNMPDLSACADAGTMHPYPGGLLPMAAVASTRVFTGSFVKGKAFWITETGYHTNVNGTVNHWQPGVSELAAAKYITREYLDYFAAGIPHSSTYEFIDEWNDANNDEGNFGLVHNDGTPKPAYLALQRLLAAVADPGAAFTPASFSYTLSGTTSATRSLALAKRNGVVDLLLWNDVVVYNTTAKSDINNTPVTVKVTLTKTPSKITTEFPVSSSALTPIAAALSFSVSVQDAPVIVEITP